MIFLGLKLHSKCDRVGLILIEFHEFVILGGISRGAFLRC